MQVGNGLHQNLFYTGFAGNGEAVHERPTNWSYNTVSEKLGLKKCETH